MNNISRWWHDPAHVIQSIGIGIGTIVALIYAGQLCQMIKSNGLTRDSMVASSRAWISPMSAGFVEAPQQGKPLKFGIQYGNPGKSPAFDVRPTYKIRSVPKSSFDDNSIRSSVESDDVCKGVVEAAGADVIYPEQPDGYKLGFQTSEPNFINDPEIFDGRKVFLMEMCFACTTFGKLHHTSFCYFYEGGRSKANQWNICMAGNHAD